MHFQIAPHEESKLIRCVQGKVFDVIVDLRTNSETFLQWEGIELSAENNNSVYVPEGVAHGFQTLENNSTIFYQISESYFPNCAKGFRWNDENIGIKWPLLPTIISKKDQNLPLYQK